MTRILVLLSALAAAAFFVWREWSAAAPVAAVPTAPAQRVQAMSVEIVSTGAPNTPTPEYIVTALALESTAAANAQLFANATKQTIDNAVAEKLAAVKIANLKITESVLATEQAKINATNTPTPTPTITPTPNATVTAYAVTAAAQIWLNRVSESEANQNSAERGAQIVSMFAGLVFIIVLAISIALFFFGWRWLAYTKDDLAEREHRRKLADREHAARLGVAKVEQAKEASAQSAAEERQASVNAENFQHWRGSLRRYLSWVKALPNAVTSRPRMEDLRIVTRDNWNKCARVLQQLGALTITPNGPTTERRVVVDPKEFERQLAPQTLAAALEAAGEKLEYPPTVAPFDNARAREITENIERAAAKITPPLSEVVPESVNAR